MYPDIGEPTAARCMYCQEVCEARLAAHKSEPEPPGLEPESGPEPLSMTKSEVPETDLRKEELYERIISVQNTSMVLQSEKMELLADLMEARAENASYVEQIGRLEAELKQAKGKIKELETKVRALAQ